MGRLQRVTRADTLDVGIRFAVWDLETSSLNGSFGHVLTGSIKPLGREPITFRIDQFPHYEKKPWDDIQLVDAIKQELEKHHVIVGYNSNYFDTPMLNTRLVASKQEVLSPLLKHIDLYLIARYRLRLGSNSLESLLTHLKCKHKKTHLDPEVWRKAVGGDAKSLDYIVAHNIADVVATEEAFVKLIPFLDFSFRLIR